MTLYSLDDIARMLRERDPNVSALWDAIDGLTHPMTAVTVGELDARLKDYALRSDLDDLRLEVVDRMAAQ